MNQPAYAAYMAAQVAKLGQGGRREPHPADELERRPRDGQSQKGGTAMGYFDEDGSGRPDTPTAARPVLATAASLPATASRADDYPSRPVRMIAPFGAGGSDRHWMCARARPRARQNAVPEFFHRKPSPWSTGTELVAKATPSSAADGKQHADRQRNALQEQCAISFLAPMEENDLVLVVNPGVPAHKMLPSRLRLPRQSRERSISHSSGPGSNYHMGRPKNLTGINIVHVPYRA